MPTPVLLPATAPVPDFTLTIKACGMYIRYTLRR